jgi:hypothetical protein
MTQTAEIFPLDHFSTPVYDGDSQSPGFIGTRRTNRHVNYITVDAICGCGAD